MDLYVLMYKSFEHGLWLLNQRQNIYQDNSATAIEKAKEKVQERDGRNPESILLDARVLTPRGEMVTLNGFSDRQTEYPWERMWANRTHDLKLMIDRKGYGLRASKGWNLSCPDFRCSGVYPSEEEGPIVGILSCSKKHWLGDPFAVASYPLVEKIPPEISDEDLARKLNSLRGTKAQAQFRLKIWKETIEAQLQLWHPF